MLKINTEKRYRYLLITLLIIVFGIVTFSLDLYPGGYKINYSSDEQSYTLTKKDILQSEQYRIDKTEISNLKVALIEYEVTFLKGLWLISIILFSSWLTNLFNLLEQDKIKPALIISSIYTVIFIVVIFVYIDRLNFMNEVIEKLIV